MPGCLLHKRFLKTILVLNISLKHLSKQSLRTATKSQAAWMSMYLTHLFLVKVVIVVILVLLLDGFLES